MPESAGTAHYDGERRTDDGGARNHGCGCDRDDRAQRRARSVTGEPRGPLCGMGICFECRATIDGMPHQRSCQILCAAGMEVRTP